MDNLNSGDAMMLAYELHKGQVDKQGQPYIHHLMAVMCAVGNNEDAKVVALLHDSVEDAGMTLERLRDLGYSEAIVSAIDAISRRESEVYANYIQRVKANDLARQVKLADLKHNLSRIDSLEDALQRESLRNRYLKAQVALQA